MIAWGVEADQVAELGSIVEVRPRGDGGWRVELVFYRQLAELPGVMASLYEGEPEAAGVFCDPMPTAPVLERLRRSVWVRMLEAVDAAAAAAQFREAVRARQVSAADHPALEQAITYAVRRPLATAYGYERRKVPCDMSPLNAAAFGLWGLRQNEMTSDPEVWVI